MKIKEYLKKNGSNILATMLGYFLGWIIVFTVFMVGRLGYNAIVGLHDKEEPTKTDPTVTETIQNETKPGVEVDTEDFRFNADLNEDREWLDYDMYTHMKPTLDDIIDTMVRNLGEASRPDVSSVLNTAAASDILGGLTVSYYPPFDTTFVVDGVGCDLSGNEIAFTIGMSVDHYGEFGNVGIYKWEQVKG